MKCHSVYCPHCGKLTLIPTLKDEYYTTDCIGFADGEFNCIQCGERYAVTCLVKIDETQAFVLSSGNHATL